MNRTIQVVAAILENEHGEILCALRSPQMSMPNRWEFPGGKVEAHENIYSAIEREIKEELSCRIIAQQVFNEHIHKDAKGTIHLTTIKGKIVHGTPTAHEHSIIIWLKRENLDSLKWAPADLPAVEQLIHEQRNR